MNVTYYHRRRADGRVCGVDVMFDGSLTLRVVWSCDGRETGHEISAEEFTDAPVSCFVCVAEGKR